MAYSINIGTRLSLLLALFIFKSSMAVQPRLPEGHVALFVFGDSLYDPGNNNYINTTTEFQANFWPYGESYFDPPTGRFSDGRLIPDFISEYAGLPLIPPYLKPGTKTYEYGVNFASGGAGALAETHQGFVIDLKTQLSYFKRVERKLRHELGEHRVKRLISTAVYMFSVGINDYTSPCKSDPTFFEKFSKKEYTGLVLGNITQVIQGIYESGGRKFGFVNMPPLERFPASKAVRLGKTGSCSKQAMLLPKLHNRALPKALNRIQTMLVGFQYSIHDLHTSMTQRMDDPKRYGFKEAKVGCCGSGRYRGEFSCGGKREKKEFELCNDVNDFFFFDSAHPSQSASKQLSTLIWNGSSRVTKPYNVKQLFQL